MRNHKVQVKIVDEIPEEKNNNKITSNDIKKIFQE